MPRRPRALALLVGAALLTGAAAGALAQPAATGPRARPAPGARVGGRVRGLLRYRKQVLQAHDELHRADHRPLRRAFSSFGNPSMAPAERRVLLREAAGPPLTDSALALTRGLVTFIPKGAFGRAGRAGKPVGTHGAVRTQWWSSFIPQDLEGTGRALDQLTEAAMRPEFRGQLDTALGVLRVAGKIEADNLAAIGASLPPEKVPEVKAALSRYAASMAAEVVDATGAAPMTFESREATRRLVEGLVDLAAQVPATADLPAAERDVGFAVAKLHAELEHGATLIQSAAARLEERGVAGATEEVDWVRMTRRIAVHNRRLTRTVSRAVDASPEARAAASQIGRDAELVGRFAVGMARIVGAGSNKEMPATDRARVVKEAAESMGPIFVKLVQTIINQSGGLEQLGIGGGAGDDVVLMALTQLQDEVTPMREAEVRAQIRASLGKDIEEAYAEFDMKPFRSASIAQVHKAKIWIKPTPLSRRRLVEVAVKVQRPGLERDLTDAVRASRMAMALVRESLTTFDVGKKMNIDPVKIRRGLDLADNSLADFIRSFHIETDFDAERKNMDRFARMVRSEPDVFVPRAFKKHSGRTVLTMEFVRGDKLADPTRPDSKSDYVKRLVRAEAARAQAPPADGPLAPGDGAEADARARASDHATRTYGLDPTALELTPASDKVGGFEVTVRFASESQPRARFRVARDGSIADRGTVPDFTRLGATEMRDRLIGSFINHILVNRFVHGDIHKGNFKILADGKTLALLDFGQVVKLDMRHFIAPAKFGIGLWRRKTGMMADAIVAMSDQYPRLSRSERGVAAREVRAVLDETMAGSTERFSPDTLSEALVGASARANLTLSSVYLQWMKTSFSMVGNVNELKGHADSAPLKTGVRTAKRMARTVLSKHMPWGIAMGVLKRRRMEKLLRESAEDGP